MRLALLPNTLASSTASHQGRAPALARALALIAQRNGDKPRPGRDGAFKTNLAALDAIAPAGGFARGAVHELLSRPPHRPPLTVAAFLAACAIRDQGDGAIVWNDPHALLYPPALAAMGVPLERLLLLRPRRPADEVWAVAECAACRGVAATIAAFHGRRLSRVQVRRLQLSAERGGGIALLLRPHEPRGAPYAAATRWLVRPAPGDSQVRRWEIQLVHGHGGRIGQAALLEVCRETNLVRASEVLADRPAAPLVKIA